jgi:hypothetical protein
MPQNTNTPKQQLLSKMKTIYQKSYIGNHTNIKHISEDPLERQLYTLFVVARRTVGKGIQ